LSGKAIFFGRSKRKRIIEEKTKKEFGKKKGRNEDVTPTLGKRKNMKYTKQKYESTLVGGKWEENAD